jgi:hypothetical protein
MTPDDLDFYRRQLLLQDFATWAEARSETGGYITSVIDAATMSTTILWHGPDSTGLQEILDEGRRRDISVAVKRRKFSRERLYGAAHAVFDSSETGVFSGFKIYTVATIDPDFDGIVVGGDYLVPPGGSRADADTALALAASAEFDIAVAIEPGSELVR